MSKQTAIHSSQAFLLPRTSSAFARASAAHFGCKCMLGLGVGNWIPVGSRGAGFSFKATTGTACRDALISRALSGAAVSPELHRWAGQCVENVWRWGLSFFSRTPASRALCCLSKRAPSCAV
eukprot:362142-Chlamydomonas_euryale.AAC.3